MNNLRVSWAKRDICPCESRKIPCFCPLRSIDALFSSTVFGRLLVKYVQTLNNLNGKVRLMKRFTALFAVFAVALCCLTACSQNEELRLGTGNSEGMYYQFGTLLSEGSQSNADVPDIAVETTAGSSANLRLLSQGFLDMAVVQADTLYDAYNGTGFFSNSGEYTGYSAVAGLYTETCQIIVPANSDIKSIEDLAGKTVSLGERESGVLQNAQQVLDAYNIREADINAEYLSFSDSATAMKEGRIDAAFITAAVPTPAVTHLADEIGVRVLEIDPFAVNVLTKHHSYYTPCTIPANTYAGQTEAVNTVGVRAVLVARNDVPEDQVKSMMGLLFDGSIPFNEKLHSSMQPTLEDATGGIPIAFHPGAGAYYAENDIAVSVMNAEDEGSTVSASQDD